MDDARCARRWISSLRGICCRRCRAPVSGVKKVCIQQGLVTQHEFDWLHIRGRLGNVRSFVANKRLALTSIPHPRASSGSPNNTSSTPSARAGDDEVGIRRSCGEVGRTFRNRFRRVTNDMEAPRGGGGSCERISEWSRSTHTLPPVAKYG